MPHLSLTAVLPVLLIATLLGLSFHRWTAEPEPGPPPPTTAAWREAAREATGAVEPPAQPPAANAEAPPGD